MKPKHLLTVIALTSIICNTIAQDNMHTSKTYTPRIDISSASGISFCKAVNQMLELIGKNGLLPLRGALQECETVFITEHECFYDCNFLIPDITESFIITNCYTSDSDTIIYDITYFGTIGEVGYIKNKKEDFKRYLAKLKACLPSQFKGKVINNYKYDGYKWKAINNKDYEDVVMLYVQKTDSQLNDFHLVLEVYYEKL